MFSLKKIRSNKIDSFSIKAILERLGDPINDEIQLGEYCYRLSSFDPIPSELLSEKPYDNFEISIPSTGSSVFSLEGRQVDISTLLLTVNNILYKYAVDYTISSGNLIWSGGFDLEPSDSLWLRYREIV
jgi:hypothetical protein